MKISVKDYCEALGAAASVLHRAIEEKEGAKKADKIFPYLELFSSILTSMLGVNKEEFEQALKMIMSQQQGEDKGVN